MSAKLPRAAVKAADSAHNAANSITRGNACIGLLFTPPHLKSESHGIPIRHGSQPRQPPATVPGDISRLAVKDNIATRGSKTTCASGILKDYESPYDASVVEWFQRRGSGKQVKTNMDEFGMGSHSQFSYFGPVDNDGLSAGGSSGGSALVVAREAVEAGIGTDTGGSVRLPAAYTGVVGFKPSYGVIPRYGVVPYANSLDTVGLLTSNTQRMRRIFDDATMLHNDPRDPTAPSVLSRKRYSRIVEQAAGTVRLQRLKIGVPQEYNIKELKPVIRQTWVEVLKTLQSKGHEIVPISLPSTKQALSAYYVIAAAESASNLSKYDGVRYGSRAKGSDGQRGTLYAATRGEGFGEEVKRRILLGSYTLSSTAIDNHFIKAQKVRRLVQRDFDRVFAMQNPLRDPEQFDLSDMEDNIVLENKLGPSQVDVIICPTAPTQAPYLSIQNNSEHRSEARSSVEAYTNDIFTVPASLAGLPAISVPVKAPESHNKVKGLRPGIQVIGQYWDDMLVLLVAEMIEDSASE